MLVKKKAINKAFDVFLVVSVQCSVYSAQFSVLSFQCNLKISKLLNFLKKTGEKTCVYPPAHVKTST
ncbi:hypothetical protein AEQU3_01660 [Aequorivita antarctica]|nr:hypothetical protein AEQU3_01660 [Aequorivita antarctica]